MQYIIIGLLGYALLRLIRNIREADKEAKREAESQRRAEETAQMRAEFRRQQTESKRIVAEQIRQAKELAKHEEQLAKHEKRIADLEFKAEQAERDIEFLTETIGNLDGLNDHYKMLQCGTLQGSKEWVKYQNKIMTLENKTHTAEARLAKAQHAKEMAEKELCA
jgi:chromosome segregation ATPase